MNETMSREVIMFLSPSSANDDSSFDLKNHSIFLAGFPGAGQQELHDALSTAEVVLPADFSYKRFKKRFESATKIIAFKSDQLQDDLNYILDFDMEGYTPTSKRIIVFCLDSNLDIDQQLIALETLIIMQKNRNYQGQYFVLTNITHAHHEKFSVSSQKNQILLKKLTDTMEYLQRANYLQKDKLTLLKDIKPNVLSYRNLKNYIFNLVTNLLIPKPSVNVEVIQKADPAIERNKFQKFLEDYHYEYKHAGIFKHSNFIKEYKDGKINTMQDVMKFADKHPTSRTAYLLKKQFNHPAQTAFARFLNKHDYIYANAGLFKRSKFRQQVLLGKINSMEEATKFAATNPSSRTAKLIKNFR